MIEIWSIYRLFIVNWLWCQLESLLWPMNLVLLALQLKSIQFRWMGWTEYRMYPSTSVLTLPSLCSFSIVLLPKPLIFVNFLRIVILKTSQTCLYHLLHNSDEFQEIWEQNTMNTNASSLFQHLSSIQTFFLFLTGLISGCLELMSSLSEWWVKLKQLKHPQGQTIFKVIFYMHFFLFMLCLITAPTLELDLPKIQIELESWTLWP